MNLLDMRTVIVSYIISNAICALVIAFLWIQNRKRFEGLGFWLADFMMQFVALLLVALRGVIPDLLSMTVSNSLVISGTILLYIGLERFVRKRSTQWHNLLLLAVFIPVHIYFVVYPNLAVRNILFSLGLLASCAQIAWLMLRRVDTRMSLLTRSVGILFVAYSLISIVRIVIDLNIASDNDFFHSNVYDTLLVLLYQMLFIVLTFNLFLMVNQHLMGDLERDIQARIQTEEALKFSEEKFQKVFYSSPDSVTITRASDGQMVEVNEGFSRITGYSREEALDNSSIALGLWANPQDRESVIRTLQEGLRIRNGEYDFRSKSGQIITGLFSAEIIRLDNEPHVISVIRDITERKQAGETVVSLAKFPSENPNPVMRVGGNGVILYANQSSAPILNAWQWQVNQILPEDWQKLIVSTLASGQIHEHEMECEGRLFALNITPVANENYVNIYGRDITERKQAEQKLNEAKEKAEEKTLQLLQLENNLNNAMVYQLEWTVMDNGEVDKRIRHISNMVVKFYDCTPEQAIADSSLIYNKIHKDDIQRLIDEEATALKNMTTFDTVVRVFNPNGEIRWSHYTSTPRKHNGKIYWDGVEVDITERKRAEEATIKLNAELEQRVIERTAQLEERKNLISELEKKNDELERFTYTVSHDLKAPLVTIRGFLGYLEKDIQSSNSQQIKSDMDRIASSTDKMQKLLEGLLKLSRAGRTIDHPEAASLETIVREAVNLLEGQINEKGVQVEVADGLPEIYGDPTRLTQVMQNLIDNAVKFIGDQPNPIIEIGQREDDAESNPVFFVRDNGMGIAPEHLERVFGLFNKLDSQAEGTGIGLATVKRIIETHGGRIWVESEGLGKGSTFCFTIPDGR